MAQKSKYYKSQIRIEKIFEVATELFLQRGYDSVSLNDIVAISGGSLASIYKYFKSKENLFLHVVEFHTQRLDKKLDNLLSLDENLAPQEYLSEFAPIYFDFIYSAENQKFLKNILLGTSKTFGSMLKNVSKIFLDTSTLAFPAGLSNYFRAHIDEFDSADPEYLARYFCFLLREPYFNRLIFFGEEPNLDKENFIKDRIKIFLHGVKKQ